MEVNCCIFSVAEVNASQKQLPASVIVKLPVLGLRLGVDFTFAGDNGKNENENDKNDNPHLDFVKGTVLEDKEQGVGIRDK